MRSIWKLMTFVVLAAALVLPGCGPELSEEELGTIVYEVPKVSGSEAPYELPPATSQAPTPKDSQPSGQSSDSTGQE